MGFIARAFEYYEGLPHQREAIAKLEGMVPVHCVEAFARIFSPSDDLEYCLPVPFMSQLDNALMAHRTCNPSSCAMCLEYLEPGMINGDDDLIVEMEKRVGRDEPHRDDKNLVFMGLSRFSGSTSPKMCWRMKSETAGRLFWGSCTKVLQINRGAVTDRCGGS